MGLRAHLPKAGGRFVRDLNTSLFERVYARSPEAR